MIAAVILGSLILPPAVMFLLFWAMFRLGSDEVPPLRKRVRLTIHTTTGETIRVRYYV